jgi:hypothetical protein
VPLDIVCENVKLFHVAAAAIHMVATAMTDWPQSQSQQPLPHPWPQFITMVWIICMLYVKNFVANFLQIIEK